MTGSIVDGVDPLCADRDAPRSRVRPAATARAPAVARNSRYFTARVYLTPDVRGPTSDVRRPASRMAVVRILRIHDPARRPPSAMDTIRPGQFVVFARDLASGGPCDFEGRPYADPAQAECAIGDSLAEARAFGEKAVGQTPSMRLDVFDA